MLTLWDWGDPKVYLHDVIATDRRNPTVNANGKIYGAPEDSAGLRAGARSGDAHRDRTVSIRCAIRSTPSSQGRRRWQPSPYWGDEPIWDSTDQRPQPDDGREGPRLVHGARSARPTIRRSASRAPTIRRRSCSRSNSVGRHLSMYDPKTRQVHADRHLLPHAPPDLRRGRQQHAVDSSGGGGPASSAGSTARCSRRPATRRSRRAGRRSSSTPTATASATPASSRTSRSIRRRTSASRRPSTASPSVRSTARSGASVLGLSRAASCASIPGRIRRRRRSPKSTSRRCDRATAPRGVDIDRNGVFWASLASGHLGEFDRRKCKVR